MGLALKLYKSHIDGSIKQLAILEEILDGCGTITLIANAIGDEYYMIKKTIGILEKKGLVRRVGVEGVEASETLKDICNDGIYFEHQELAVSGVAIAFGGCAIS